MADSSSQATLDDGSPNIRVIQRVFLWGMVVIGLCSAVIFTVWPEIDLWVAAQFMDADCGFAFKRSGAGKILRLGFMAVYVFGSVVAIFSLLLAISLRSPVIGFRHGRWLFLVLTLIIGPGLVANVMLKDHWGRARPVHVSTLGKTFSSALIPSDQCARNCSFVSGESASIFALFFGLALMGGAWQWFWLYGGLALGSAAGLMRMAQGGHYLSDVVFSGIFMALVALALSYLTRALYCSTRPH